MRLRSKRTWFIVYRRISYVLGVHTALVGILCVSLGIAPCLWAENGLKSSEWPEVSLNLMALDRNSEVIPNLAPGDVSVIENGIPQTVTNLNQVNSPASVCILVDVSSSMAKFIEEERRIAQRIIQESNPNDEFCILSVQWQTFVERGFTKDRELLTRALAGLHASGPTAYLDGIPASAKYMGQHASNSTQILIMLTDAGDNASHISSSKVAQDLKSDGSLFCVLVLAAEGNDNVYQDVGRLLREPVEATGGLIFYANSTTKMDSAVDELTRAISGRYRLTYTSTYTDRNGKWRSVDVKPLKTSGSVKMSLHAPKGYYAPSQ